jgi:hypothetical protein
MATKKKTVDFFVSPSCHRVLVTPSFLTKLLALLVATSALAAEPPAIPIGLDAFRQWDQWPLQRIGQRTYMRSTYDRRGGNEGADASHFLYQLGDDNNVTLDLEGPGILAFARYNHWHGSPWRYTVDGAETIVTETSTQDPTKPVANSVFEPAAAFPAPLTFAWSITRGADLSWVPIEFEKSFRMAYSRTRYGTGYYIFHRFVPGTPLSHPLQAWNADSAPPADVLALINRAGEDIAPTDIPVTSGAGGVAPHQAITLGELSGAGVIRALKVDLPQDVSADDVRIRITWDDRSDASVDAPLPLFFGAGTLYNRDGREFLVNAFPVNIRFADGRIYLACYFPMPFFSRAKI